MRRNAAAVLAATLVASWLPGPAQTATPIQHIVVIFDENISFDHYFGTYPNALNPPHETPFKALPETPRVNGLTAMLLEHNPNYLNAKVNQSFAVNPFRLGPAQAATADQNHDYTLEQRAFDSGLMDAFPQYTGVPALATQMLPPESLAGAPLAYVNQTKALVMGYYDGNTVTALWNYAQRYALNDNSYASTFGQSTQGAIELISGQTNGVTDQINAAAFLVEGGQGTYIRSRRRRSHRGCVLKPYLGPDALPGPSVDHAQGRCGYGPRLPLLVISPFARRNYVDHSLTDQTSILRFLEDNWLAGERVGGGSFDALAGSLNAMLDFSHPDARPYLLDEATGQILKR